MEKKRAEMPLLSQTTAQVLTNCLEMKNSEKGLRTLFIASYPKSGTTWMQCIIYNLLSRGNQDFDHISFYSPFFEIEKTWDSLTNTIASRYDNNHTSLGWRVFNTHLRWEMMPKDSSMKYINVVRNGRDVALSFFKHLTNQDDGDGFEGSFRDFLTLWAAGNLPFGNWLDHLESWTSAYKNQSTSTIQDTNNDKILLVKYEDLIEDLRSTVLKIVNFLDLTYSNEEIMSILPFLSFSYMRENESKYMPISVPWKNNYHFLRKGVVGDFKFHFGSEEEKIYRLMIEKAIKDGLISADVLTLDVLWIDL